MALTAMDEYDIQRTFEVLDEDKSNRITLKSLHTLFLGLGFQPKQLPLRELKDKVVFAISRRVQEQMDGVFSAEDAEWIEVDSLPLSLVLEVLSQFRRENRSYELEKSFQLLDQANKGFINATDLQRLSNEVGEPLSVAEAKVLVKSNMGLNEFSNVFSPPSP